MHNTHSSHTPLQGSLLKHFSNINPTLHMLGTLHTPTTQLLLQNSTLGFTSTLIFPSNSQTKQENKGKLTLIPSIGCKEALEPENTKITTLLLLDLGSDTVHPSPRLKTHKSRMKWKKKMKEISWD